MALTIKEDLVYGSGAKLTPNGPEATRIFSVQATEGEKEFAILDHDDIPDLYDEFPYVESPQPFISIYAQDISCNPVDENNNVFKVIVSYSRPELYGKAPSDQASDAVIQIGSSLTTSRTANDKDGARITVSLTGQPDQVGEVEKQTPELVLLFERKESTAPTANARTYTGKVNSASLGSGDYLPGTLMCLGIEGNTTDDGETWAVSYRFQYRPETWKATAIYTDDQNRPHPDIDLTTSPADGVAHVDIYQQADFDNLNLNFDAT